MKKLYLSSFRNMLAVIALFVCASAGGQTPQGSADASLHDNEQAITRKRFTQKQKNVDYNALPDADNIPPVRYELGVPNANAHNIRTQGGMARSAGWTKSVGANAAEAADDLPDHWNNGLTKYFPPFFYQSGPSCMGSAFTGYMFTHELNALRNLDGSLEDNQMAIFFSWLLTYQNSSKEDVEMYNGSPSATDYGGRTNSSIYGYYDWHARDAGWMQGYDKWHRAMFNRAQGFYTFPNHVGTEAGRMALKRWLYNHNGDTDFRTGGVCYITVGASSPSATIKSTPANEAAGVVGLRYIDQWDKAMNHALTIIGYDDRIEFDLDDDGVYGDEAKDEKGAWIVANSWGENWANGGWTYVPYRYGGVTGKVTSGDWWQPYVTYARKNYRPKRTLKLLMDYDHRSELALSVGISADTAAATTASRMNMSMFQNAGDGGEDRSGGAPAVPMLGKYADGLMHTEPMEFGYDLTDLSSGFDNTQPLKYFFNVRISGRLGKGHIYKASIIDYNLNTGEGVEIPFQIDTVTLDPKVGSAYSIAVVVPGEKVNAPVNARLNNTTLTWGAPMPTSLRFKRYYIYQDNVKIDSVSAALKYTVSNPNSVYCVSAAYDYLGTTVESEQSNTARLPIDMPAGANRVLSAQNATMVIPNAIIKQMPQGTIEFWLKPHTIDKNSVRLGGSDNDHFFIGVSASGQLQAGWSSDNALSSAAKSIKPNVWTHVAVVVENNQMTLYLNGMKKGSTTANAESGMPRLGDLIFGTSGNLLNAEIDELRVWRTARTQVQIYANKDNLIADPSNQPDLLTYIPMNAILLRGDTFFQDFARGNHAYIRNARHNLAFANQKTIEITPINGANIAKSAQKGISNGEMTSIGNGFAASSNDVVATDYGVTSIGNEMTASSNDVAATDGEMTAIGNEIAATDGGVATIGNGVVASNDDITASSNDVMTTDGEITATDNEMTDGGAYTILVDTTILGGGRFVQRPSIAMPDSVCAGQNIIIGGDASLNTIKWAWSLPGATPSVATVQSPHVIYKQEGEYTATLTVTDNKGVETSVERTFTVHKGALPVPQFDLSATRQATGKQISFINRTQSQDATYRWDIQGQGSLLMTNGTTAFDTAGVYNITLTATNAVGSASISKQVEIYETLPSSQFNISPNSILKGEATYLEDHTPGKPNDWIWTLSNGKRYVQVMGQYSSLVLPAPGYYDVSLQTTNDVGSNILTRQRALCVSNADAKNGLNFVGLGEQLEFRRPFAENQSAFTVEWWMNPNKLQGAGGFQFGPLTAACTQGNSYKVQFGTRSFNFNGYLTTGQWHHYALTYDKGIITLYVDGERKTSYDASRYAVSNWGDTFTFGREDNPMTAYVDELRIWDMALTQEQIQAVCNQPVADPANAAHLCLYYDFNQNGGDVIDRTGKGNDAKRVHFGPDGDAWITQKGVFTLDFGDDIKIENVTSQYLTNYKSPFLRTNECVNVEYRKSAYALQTETEQSAWIFRSPVVLKADTLISTVYVDGVYDNNLYVSSGFNFGRMINQRLWQTVSLPQGHYRFTFTPGNAAFTPGQSRIVVSFGDTIPDNADISNALASSLIEQNRIVEFDVPEGGTNVSLGLLFNLNDVPEFFHVKEFQLYKVSSTTQLADDVRSAYDAVKKGLLDNITGDNGGIRVVSDEPMEVKIYSADGRCVFNQYVSGNKRVSLPAGLYIANGKKVKVY